MRGARIFWTFSLHHGGDVPWMGASSSARSAKSQASDLGIDSRNTWPRLCSIGFGGKLATYQSGIGPIRFSCHRALSCDWRVRGLVPRRASETSLETCLFAPRFETGSRFAHTCSDPSTWLGARNMGGEVGMADDMGSDVLAYRMGGPCKKYVPGQCRDVPRRDRFFDYCFERVGLFSTRTRNQLQSYFSAVWQDQGSTGVTATSMSVQEVSDQSVARWRDYVALTKPRISFMVLLTVVAAGFLASTVVSVSALRVFNAVIGTLLVAASGSALNQCVERLLDARMSRTSNRPLPSGRLGLTEVVVFGTITLCVGLVYLWLAISPMVAGIGFATWVMYVWIYTPLKTRTWTNTIVGAVAGAMPVLIGWFATGATIHPWIIGLFSLLFLWQFPHFMAIAWLYREEYEAGGMQMLPVVDRYGFWTAIKAVLSAGLLIPVTLLPVVALEGWTQIIYGLIVAALGGFYLYGACLFLRERSDRVARKLLRISLLHLPLMMLVMVLSAWVCS